MLPPFTYITIESSKQESKCLQPIKVFFYTLFLHLKWQKKLQFCKAISYLPPFLFHVVDLTLAMPQDSMGTIFSSKNIHWQSLYTPVFTSFISQLKWLYMGFKIPTKLPTLSFKSYSIDIVANSYFRYKSLFLCFTAPPSSSTLGIGLIGTLQVVYYLVFLLFANIATYNF